MDTDHSLEKVDVPSYFLCPISLELMRDPVIVPTGITYDRDNIEKWLFFFNKATCPVTKQPLSACSDLTPNHTLRRLIQSWCTLNSYVTEDRITLPMQSSMVSDVAYVHKLIDEAKSNPNLAASCIERLRKICSVNKRNLKCLEKAGGVEFIVSVIVSNRVNTNSTKIGSNFINEGCLVNSTLACLDEDALFLIQEMDLDAATFKNIVHNNVDFIHLLAQVMKSGTHSSQSRAYSVLISRSLCQAADPSSHVINVPTEMFISIVRILDDNISIQATKNAMKLLVEICPWGRNRIKAVEAKAVSTLINLLLQSLEKRIIEISLTVLDQLCGCAEGRSELLNHEEGLAVVARKLLRVSHWASDKAVRILSSVSKHSANPVVLQEMLNVGLVEKMLLVLQAADCGVKMKARCREMLRLHVRVWRASHCIPPCLLLYYPSCLN